MVHVAAEMEREGFDIPLLIGGATTSRVHTAVKIHPRYASGQTVYVNDASRAVGVVSSLLSPETKRGYVETVRAEYRKVADAHARGGGRQAAPAAGQGARANAHADRLGRPTSRRSRPSSAHRVFEDWDLAELARYIDWTPFFQTWELKGRYPAILEDEKQGAAARQLFEDAQAMLARIIEESWFAPKAVIGFWPANAVGDDIRLFTDEARATGAGDLLHPAPAAVASATAGRTWRWPISSRPPTAASADYVGGFVVTAGIEEEAIAERFERANDDYSSILVKALADRFAEAFAERMHERVRREFWGYAPDEALAPDELIGEPYRGIRPAPGYPGPARPHREGDAVPAARRRTARSACA